MAELAIGASQRCVRGSTSCDIIIIIMRQIVLKFDTHLVSFVALGLNSNL